VLLLQQRSFGNGFEIVALLADNIFFRKRHIHFDFSTVLPEPDPTFVLESAALGLLPATRFDQWGHN
jgi:hypothetical protein